MGSWHGRNKSNKQRRKTKLYKYTKSSPSNEIINESKKVEKPFLIKKDEKQERIEAQTKGLSYKD